MPILKSPGGVSYSESVFSSGKWDSGPGIIQHPLHVLPGPHCGRDAGVTTFLRSQCAELSIYSQRETQLLQKPDSFLLHEPPSSDSRHFPSLDITEQNLEVALDSEGCSRNNTYFVRELPAQLNCSCFINDHQPNEMHGLPQLFHESIFFIKTTVFKNGLRSTVVVNATGTFLPREREGLSLPLHRTQAGVSLPFRCDLSGDELGRGLWSLQGADTFTSQPSEGTKNLNKCTSIFP